MRRSAWPSCALGERRSGAGSGLHGEDGPLSGDAFECVVSLVGKFDAGSGDEVAHGRGSEDFSGACVRAYALADVYCDPADVSATLFDFPGVHTGS